MRDETEDPPSDRPESVDDSRLRGNEKLYRDLILKIAWVLFARTMRTGRFLPRIAQQPILWDIK